MSREPVRSANRDFAISFARDRNRNVLFPEPVLLSISYRKLGAFKGYQARNWNLPGRPSPFGEWPRADSKGDLYRKIRFTGVSQFPGRPDSIFEQVVTFSEGKVNTNNPLTPHISVSTTVSPIRPWTTINMAAMNLIGYTDTTAQYDGGSALTSLTVALEDKVEFETIFSDIYELTRDTAFNFPSAAPSGAYWLDRITYLSDTETERPALDPESSAAGFPMATIAVDSWSLGGPFATGLGVQVVTNWGGVPIFQFGAQKAHIPASWLAEWTVARTNSSRSFLSSIGPSLAIERLQISADSQVSCFSPIAGSGVLLPQEYTSDLLGNREYVRLAIPRHAPSQVIGVSPACWPIPP